MELKVKMTAARLIIVRELENGPKTFGQLRTAYFGEARAKANKATTAFYNKVKKGLDEDLCKKNGSGYELGEQGVLMLKAAKEQGIDLSVIKSEAQTRFEAQQS